jgi:hypothetical protein
MAYDKMRNQIVLFGGFFAGGHRADTWIFDGTKGSEKLPAEHPTAREDHAMDFDSVRNQVLLFGGVNGNSGPPFDETLAWTGTNWARVPALSPPSARYRHAMAYDAARNKLFVFGGLRSGSVG